MPKVIALYSYLAVFLSIFIRFILFFYSGKIFKNFSFYLWAISKKVKNYIDKMKGKIWSFFNIWDIWMKYISIRSLIQAHSKNVIYLYSEIVVFIKNVHILQILEIFFTFNFLQFRGYTKCEQKSYESSMKSSSVN